jgi:hypothetical protein
MNTVVQLRQQPVAEPGSFEEFWLAYPYPRRVGKAVAKAKWEAITGEGLSTRTLDRDSGQYVSIELKATPAEILSGLKKYDAKCRKKGTGNFGYEDDGKFICHPSVFLNQGRWLDFL